VEERGGLVVYGANFSVGVHVFYRLAGEAARLFARAGGYAPFLEEQHHAAKKDAPSGTALALRRIVAGAFPDDGLEVAVTRAGHIPGTHRVGFDGVPDQVLLAHTARSREGFARGALVAARWAADAYATGRRGVVPFEAVMADVLG
jgi:4-hydroxy-tetrahydrodipicolinate reductase